jgi:hypothetical protein
MDDLIGEKVLATEYLSIFDISSYYAETYFFPSFGPTYVEFYSEPNNLRSKWPVTCEEPEKDDIENILLRRENVSAINKGESDLNNEIDELVEDDFKAADTQKVNEISKKNYYVPIVDRGLPIARVFLHIYSIQHQNFELKKNILKRKKPLDVSKIILEANSNKHLMTFNDESDDEDTNYKKEKSEIKLSSDCLLLSNFGKKHVDFIGFCLINECTMLDSRLKNKKLSFKLSIGINGFEIKKETKTNTTESEVPLQMNWNMPFYLPYEKSNKCLHTEFKYEDKRYLMFKNNVVEMIYEKMVK